MKKITSRLAALLTVVLALAGLGLGALPAHAADPVNGAAPVTLNIHKYLGDPTGVPTANPHTGPTGPTGLTGIAGIKFEIYKVTNTDGSAIDLTTQAGWTTVSTLTAANATVGAALATITTDTSGLATISTGTNPAFTVGVYKVVELTKDGYSTIAPFLVTLPYSSTADGTWQYVQDVFPKNQSIRPSKEVWYTQNATALDATTAVNDVTSVSEALTYRVVAPVPTGVLDRLNIVDPLAQGQTVTGTPVLQYTPDPKATPLALTTIDPTWYTVAGAPGAVNVTFTAAGLTGLANLRATTPGLNVVLTFQATVPVLPADGKLTNTATLQLPNGGTATTDGDINADGTFSDPVTTTFAPLTITKNPAVGGATFQVFSCTETTPGSGVWTKADLSKPLTLASTTSGTPVTDFTTAGDGTVTAYGLPVSSYSTTAKGSTSEHYCVVETKAPAGFARNPEIQPVTYDSATNTFKVTVINAPNSILNQLPATGAWGLVLFFLAGIALVIRGVMVSRRRDNDDMQAA